MTSEPGVLLQLAPEALGRPLSDDEASNLCKYLKILLKWQRSQRLVGSADPDWVQRELLAASLLFARFVPATARSLLDFGSGAGVPGVPLKIVRPELDVVLLESRAKRESFLRAVLRELPLTGIRVVGGRAEGAHALYGRFDVVTARCAGALDAVIMVAARFASPEGLLLISGPPNPLPRPGIVWNSLSASGIGTRHIGVQRVAAPPADPADKSDRARRAPNS